MNTVLLCKRNYWFLLGLPFHTFDKAAYPYKPSRTTSLRCFTIEHLYHEDLPPYT